MLKNEFDGKVIGSLSFHDVFLFKNENNIMLYDIKTKKMIEPGDKVELSVGEYMINLSQAIGMDSREYLKEAEPKENNGFKINDKDFKLFSSTASDDVYNNKKVAEQMFIQGMSYLREELSLNIIDEVLRMSSENSNFYEDRKVEQLREMLNRYIQDKKLDFKDGDYSMLKAVKDRLISGQVYSGLEMNDTMEKIVVGYLNPINKDLEKFYELKKPVFIFNWVKNIERNLEQKIEKVEVKIFKNTKTGNNLEELLKQSSIDMLNKYVGFIFKDPKFHRKEDLIDIDMALVEKRRNYLEKDIDVNWQLLNIHLKNLKEEDKEKVVKGFVNSICECFDTRFFNLESVINLNKLINNEEVLSKDTIYNVKDYIKNIYNEKKESIFSDVDYKDNKETFIKEVNIKSLINAKFLKSLTMSSNIELMRALIKGVDNYKDFLSLRHCQIIRELKDRKIEEANEGYRVARKWQTLKEAENEEKRLGLIFNENLIGQIVKMFTEDKNSFDVHVNKSALFLLCKIKKEDNELFNKILFNLLDSDVEHKDIWDDIVSATYENSKMKSELLKNKDEGSPRKRLSKF